MFAVQCKMARAALGLGVRELAEQAKVSPDTVARFERGEPLKERTVESLQRALEAAGVIFLAENGDGPGVRLRKGVKPTAATIINKDHEARGKAETAVDEALAGQRAAPKEKAQRKQKLTQVPKELKPGRDR